MAITINDNFGINSPKVIDDRLIVATFSDLVLLDANTNYPNMYVWVKNDKSFYYLNDGVSGTSSSHWTIEDGVQSITHTNLRALKIASGLKPGKSYLITDFITTHRIQNTTTINVGPNEPIIVTATSVNTLSLVAYQPIYPNDVIHYDIDNILCEDGTTPRTGKILYRKDCKQNVSCWYDWRNVKFRRWKVNTTTHAAWSAVTSYTTGNLVNFGASLWISKVDSNLNNSPTQSDGRYWNIVLKGIDTMYHLPLTTFQYNFSPTLTISADLTQFKDMYTFHNMSNDTLFTTTIKDIRMEGSTFLVYNNIVIQCQTVAKVFDDVFEGDCGDMTIITDSTGNGRYFFATTFHPYCTKFITRDVYYARFESQSTCNIFGSSFTNARGLFAGAIIGDSVSGVITMGRVQNVRIAGGNTDITFTGLATGFELGLNICRIMINRAGVPTPKVLGDNTAAASNPLNDTMIGPHQGTFIITTGSLDSTSTNGIYRLPITFTGTTGKGTVGSVTLDGNTFIIPVGYGVNTVRIAATGLTYSAGAKLNIGANGNIGATGILDNTTGDLVNVPLNGSYYTVHPNLVLSSTNQTITMSVTGATVSAGTLRFTFEFSLLK